MTSNIIPKDYVEGENYQKLYWVAIREFKYNTKVDRFYDAPMGSAQTKENVPDIVVKKGDKLPKDFVSSENYLKELKKYIRPISVGSVINFFSNKNLLILAVIVGGYFAYKKFKK